MRRAREEASAGGGGERWRKMEDVTELRSVGGEREWASDLVFGPVFASKVFEPSFGSGFGPGFGSNTGKDGRGKGRLNLASNRTGVGVGVGVGMRRSIVKGRKLTPASFFFRFGVGYIVEAYHIACHSAHAVGSGLADTEFLGLD